jgi:hypothetical protein
MAEVIVLDNFYENPDLVREKAIDAFKEMIDENLLYDSWHFNDFKGDYDDIPGLINEDKTIVGRTFETSSVFNDYHEKIFEKLLHSKIQYTCEKNGIFVLNNCLTNPISVNINNDFKTGTIAEEWVGIIFLTPDAPVEGGISIKTYKRLNINSMKTLNNMEEPFRNLILNQLLTHKRDETYWEIDSQIANVYNRLILMKKNIFYSSSLNFGIRLNDSRLTHYFSFGVIPN